MCYFHVKCQCSRQCTMYQREREREVEKKSFNGHNLNAKGIRELGKYRHGSCDTRTEKCINGQFHLRHCGI